MSASTRDWKEYKKDSKEKYSRYLCSREWNVLKEQVRERSGGICERCKIHPMSATHHLTYERKYKELVEDLQAICQGCHDFTHGKSNFDPANRHPFYLYACEAVANGLHPISSAFVYRIWGEVHPIVKLVYEGLLAIDRQNNDLVYQADCDGDDIPDWLDSYFENQRAAFQFIQQKCLRCDVVGYVSSGCPYVDANEYHTFVYDGLKVSMPRDFQGNWEVLE